MSPEELHKAILREAEKIIKRKNSTHEQDMEDIKKIFIKYGLYKEKQD